MTQNKDDHDDYGDEKIVVMTMKKYLFGMIMVLVMKIVIMVAMSMKTLMITKMIS